MRQQQEINDCNLVAAEMKLADGALTTGINSAPAPDSELVLQAALVLQQPAHQPPSRACGRLRIAHGSASTGSLPLAYTPQDDYLAATVAPGAGFRRGRPHSRGHLASGRSKAAQLLTMLTGGAGAAHRQLE